MSGKVGVHNTVVLWDFYGYGKCFFTPEVQHAASSVYPWKVTETPNWLVVEPTHLKNMFFKLRKKHLSSKVATKFWSWASSPKPTWLTSCEQQQNWHDYLHMSSLSMSYPIIIYFLGFVRYLSFIKLPRVVQAIFTRLWCNFGNLPKYCKTSGFHEGWSASPLINMHLAILCDPFIPQLEVTTNFWRRSRFHHPRKVTAWITWDIPLYSWVYRYSENGLS